METPLLGLPPAPLPSALRKPMRDGPPPVPTSLARGSSAPHPAAPAGSGGLAARQMLARGVSAAPGDREQQRKRVRIISGVAEGLASGGPLRQRTRTLIQRQHSAAAHVEDAFSGWTWNLPANGKTACDNPPGGTRRRTEKGCMR